MAYPMSQWLLNLTKSGDFAYCEPRTTFLIKFSRYSGLILAIGYEVKGGFAHMQRKCRPAQTFPIPGIPAWLTDFLLLYVWAEKRDTATGRVAGPVRLVWISATGLRERLLTDLFCVDVCVHEINPLWNWPCNLCIQYHCRLFSWVGERVFAELCRHISENLHFPHAGVCTLTLSRFLMDRVR